MPNASVFACPACRNPASHIHQFQDAVVVTGGWFGPDGKWQNGHAGLHIDHDSLHNMRYECQDCGVQFNQPIDLTAPEPEPDDAPARVDDLARRA